MSVIFVLMVVATPAAHAYTVDHGIVSCGAGKKPALQVKAKGNPVSVRAVNYSGQPVIYANFYTYSGTSTRVFYPSGRYAGKYMEWNVFVKGENAYVSRDGTFGYCFNA
jgi:hypothetical protein